MPLATRLSNLHLLLHVPSFARWPLELRFFCGDVYESWIQRSAATTAPMHRNIRVHRDFEVKKDLSKGDDTSIFKSFGEGSSYPTSSRDVKDIDPTYRPIKGHVEVGQALEARSEALKCICCKEKGNPHLEMIAICPEQRCQAPSHVACLSQRFLESEQSQEIVPVEGQCPRCRTTLKWVDLVKELTLRMRGEKEIKRLMKPSKKKVASQAEPREILSEEEDEDAFLEELEEGCALEDVIDEPHQHEVEDLTSDDEWETFSASSKVSESHSTIPAGKNSKRYAKTETGLSPVVEDSDDWASDV